MIFSSFGSSSDSNNFAASSGEPYSSRDPWTNSFGLLHLGISEKSYFDTGTPAATESRTPASQADALRITADPNDKPARQSSAPRYFSSMNLIAAPTTLCSPPPPP